MTTYWDGSYPPSVLHPEPPPDPDPEVETDESRVSPHNVGPESSSPKRRRKPKATEEVDDE